MFNGINLTLNSDLALVPKLKTLLYIVEMGKKHGNHPLQVCPLVIE